MWQLGGVRIYTQESNENTSQILPRLQPLSGGTVVQVFGYESLIRQISVLVVGDTNKNTLKGFSQNGGVSKTLVSPEGTLGDFVVKSATVRRTKSICQTIDTSQPEDAPVYEVDLELYEE
jgi:hypothetical protein